MHALPVTALVLSGGGARAAYQVGVLQAITRLRREVLGAGVQANPFGVICGTSAGAINAMALATHADHWDEAVARMANVWHDFHADQVYCADALGVARSGAKWLSMLSIGWVIARWRKVRPRSLLDNSPLAGLLQELIALDRLPRLLRDGHLRAVAVTASSYTSGEHCTFYDAGVPIEPWVRSQRLAIRSPIRHEHLLASSAIPFVFPAQQLTVEGQIGWFGDGSMRQTAPLSPAVHLGAERLLVVGAGRMQEPVGRRVVGSAQAQGYPTLAQIAGHAMSSIFLDGLAVDIERLQRINKTLSLLPPSALANTPLRPIRALVIAPSQRLDDIAAEHLGSLPAPVRALLRGVGVGGQGQQARGSALASYLLFEAPYTRALMALGDADVQARRDEVIDFFGWRRFVRRAGTAAEAGVAAAPGTVEPAAGQ